MGGEVFFAVLISMLGWAAIGLIVAFAIKLIGKRERLPGWPILWLAAIGTFATLMLDRVLNSN